VRLANQSLRARLLAELLILLAVACLTIGVLTELALRSYLMGQVDSRLAAASQRLAQPPPNGPPPNGPPPGGPPQDAPRPAGPQQPGPQQPGPQQPGPQQPGPQQPGQQPGGNPPPPPPDGSPAGTARPRPLEGAGTELGTLRAVNDHGRLIEPEYLGGDPSSPTRQTIPAQAWQPLLTIRAGGHPHTLDLGTELGDYRLVGVVNSQGDLAITGLPLREVQDTMLQVGLIITAVGLGALAFTGAAGAVIVRITLRPLRRVAETASRVAELPLDRGEVALSVRVPDQDTNPRTEVGKVGNALNRMLGHVGSALTARQASETRVRQFVADASHELRTPLAAIRGYAELTRRGGHQLPPDVAHAMRRVESESVRMTALVNDLLLLARLDAAAAAGNTTLGVAGMGANGAARALASQPVDLSRLAVDATSDAHVAGPGHRWRLALPEESVVVQGDEAQLHHVLGNLLANARTHTPPGTTVTVALATDGGHAVLTVTDDGPGIPPELLPEIFGRFARGDSSRSRAAGSTGLGLAIVSAVVQAHNGTVEAASRPGRTEFTVRLPLTSADAAPVGNPSHAISPLPAPEHDSREPRSNVSSADAPHLAKSVPASDGPC
jgi:two-component system OmpR family sensor kinase